jgi:YHS domain-containing protein
MRVDEWTATFFTEHGGSRFVFCSQRCLERFEANPDQYVKEPGEPTGPA